jgi:hypothetical protein
MKVTGTLYILARVKDELLEVVAVREPGVTQDIAVDPELLNNLFSAVTVIEFSLQCSALVLW